VYRFNNHEDMTKLLSDVGALYDDIECIRDVDNIYIGPLYSQSVYVYPTTSSFVAVADALANYKGLYNNKEYVKDAFSEAVRGTQHRDSSCILMCLGFLLGPRVFEHEGIVHRVQHLKRDELVNVHEYDNPLFGLKTLNTTEYARPMFRRAFELLSLIEEPINNTYHRSYGVADIFLEVHDELPTKIPLDLAWYTQTKKVYLRHIMHHPEEERYMDAFCQIRESSDRFVRRALHYFAHTIGGAYKPIDGSMPSTLSNWYDHKIDEKQLDDMFDEVIGAERRTFEELGQLGIGISIDANLRLTKRRFSRLQKLVESTQISEYKELAGPFLARDSSMLAIKILRRQIND